MQDFKFFKGTLRMMDGETYTTASLQHPRLDSNNEMERWCAERIQRDEEMRNHGIITQEQYNLNRDMLAQQEGVRRRLIETDNQIRLFQTTTVTTVNPKWWMKVKMFFQKLSLYWDQIWGIIVIATIVTVIFGLTIAKVLNIW